MYCYRKYLLGALIFAGFTFIPFSPAHAETTYKPTGDEVAGISVRFGGGYGGYYGRPYYRGRYYRPYYRGYRYGYPRYYRYYGPRRYYYDPYYYYYGRPGGGVYFRFGD